MARTRSQARARNQKRESSGFSVGSVPSSPAVSAFGLSTQGLSLPFMKKLYGLLCHLSLNTKASCSDSGSVLEMEFNVLGAEVSFKDMQELSGVLFKELVKRFEQIFSDMEVLGTTEELIMLLRCCMVILTLPISDKNHETGQYLLLILHRLIYSRSRLKKTEKFMRFEQKICQKRTYSNGDCTTSITKEYVASVSVLPASTPRLPLLCQVLEAFADELLVHSSLRKNLRCHFGHGDVGIVLEVISAHLLLTVSNEQYFCKFPSRFSWKHHEDVRFSELSLTTVLPLLLNPVINSAPEIFQTHLLSLVAEAVGVRSPSEHMKTDPGIVNCYLTAFKISVDTYGRHMKSLLKDGNSMTGKGTQTSFDSYILPSTKDKIYDLQCRLDKSWALCFDQYKSKSDLVAAATESIKEFHHEVGKDLNDQVLSILIRMVHEASSVNVTDIRFPRKAQTSPQDIFHLAAILKLMSCSLSQIIWCARKKGDLASTETIPHNSMCKEFDLIADIMASFEKIDVDLPVQDFLFSKMQTRIVNHKELKWILPHFVGLLSLYFATGLDFMVKGCIYVIVTLISFFVLVEGTSNAIELFSALSEIPSSGLSSDDTGEASAVKKSSLAIASKFLEIRTLQLCSQTQGRRQGNTEQATGANFLKRLIGNSHLPSDFSDLADFIECKPARNYSCWLRDRQTYREQKAKKMAKLRWKKKKMSLKLLWGNII